MPEKIALLLLCSILCRVVAIEKVGCRTRTGGIALPDLLVEDRANINWVDYEQFLENLVAKCAEEAEKNDYKVFGLQFYGECWGTKKSLKDISSKLHSSEGCINNRFQLCVKDDEDCIGNDRSTFLYQLEEPVNHSPLSPVHGEWSAWVAWTSCSRSCGGGTQERYRLCDHPKPTDGGGYCVGEGEELRYCNLLPCVEASGCRVEKKEHYTLIETSEHFQTNDPYCRSLSPMEARNKYSYFVSAYLYSVHQSNAPRLGLMYNVHDEKNYSFLLIKINREFHCYEVAHVINGYTSIEEIDKDRCNRPFTHQEWFNLSAYVNSHEVTFMSNGQVIAKIEANEKLQPNGRAGVIIQSNFFQSHQLYFNNLKVY